MRRPSVAQQYREHLSGYQRRDFDVVDYEMFELEGTRLSFRGPVPGSLATGQYFTCIGAAQTFGCFCERPFPKLLADRLDLLPLNLGYGGAGPEFFERHDSLDRFINRGQFVVLQVMSGRSQSNSMFECRGLEYTVRRTDGVRLSADAAYRDLLLGVSALRPRQFGAFTPLIRKVMKRLWLPRILAVPKVRQIVQETRSAWVENYRRLIARIEVPIVLLWFSKRAPAYRESLKNVDSLFGEFPQLVNAEMVNSVRESCDAYVECITSRGSPQQLVSRFSGAPISVDTALDRPDLGGGHLWTHNEYYPSPEMHEDAANVLLPACEAILQEGQHAL